MQPIPVTRIAPIVLTLALALALAASAPARAAQPARHVDDRDTVTLPGNVHPLARPEFDAGAARFDMPMDRMILSLAMRPGARAELDRLIAELHDPASPNYQHWLTPEQVADRFGPGDADVRVVTDWLLSQGFRIDEVAKSRLWVNFSGSVADVERAFHTAIRNYDVNGVVHHANSASPAIPAALADLVHGVVSMHDFPRQSLHHDMRFLGPADIAPQYTSGASHYLAPADFATIYNVAPLYASGIAGAGQTIAIVGRTDIALEDVRYFRSYFGLPANDPVIVHNGTAPGNLGGGEETEANLDVQWSGAVAKNATIKFVVSKSTSSSDGVDLSAQYIVNNNLASVMSTSFGSCESRMGSAELSFYDNLWAQAAAQGITSFVSSGDSGASACDTGGANIGSGRGVNGLCSSPNDVCVGGTQFADTNNPSAYWSGTNNATTKGTALSYIPERAWNESGSVSGGSGLWATGGGASTTFAKPSWQSAPGVPADGRRDVPDVSLTSASHVAYLVVQGHTSTSSGLGAVGGTSAASPAFAGLMALVDQKTGARQGNANTRFYALGRAQYAGGTAVFHDTTSGNNSVPGVTGFSCGNGYDAVTGLGSVDANALAASWAGTAPPPPPPPATYAVSGTITVNGAALSGVTVSTAGATATTGTAGTFTLSGLANGTYTITPSRSGYTFTPATRSVTVNGANVGAQNFTATATTTGGATEKVTDGNFETGLYGSATSGTSGATGPWRWTATLGRNPVTNASTRAYQGSWLGWLGGFGRTGTSTLSQTIGIPGTATTARFSFWLRVITSEPATGARDTMTVSLVDAAGATHVLGTFSNLNAASSYSQKAYDVSTYRGQKVTIRFSGSENASYTTSFYLDNVSVMVQ